MEKPNIIFIMADDMGYGDVGCFNPDGKIPTPNMDRLAKEGRAFTDAHSPSSVCTPTRYGVLTGRYCWRTWLKQGVTGGYSNPLIEGTRMTVASMLKEQGYATACIGKWHVGANLRDADGNFTTDENKVDFSQPIAGGPADLGFDYAYYNLGCGTCAPPYGFVEGDRFVNDSFHFYNCGASGPVAVGAWGQWGGMMADDWDTKEADVIIADKACEYIEARADSDEPFFMYLTPNAPHEPCLERFVPEFARGKSEAGARGDLVWLFDWVVGRVVETLEEAGKANNTLIMVTSDNGALPGDFVLDEDGQRLYGNTANNEYLYEPYGHRSNAHWSGYKAHIWEGGHRIPLIAWWPDKVVAGTESDELLCLTDFMATCAGIVGATLPDDAAEDSFDASPVLLNDTLHEPIREAVIHHSSFGVFSARQGQWKAVFDCPDSGGWPTPRGTPPKPGRPGQLYDVAADPTEANNLWDERQDIVQDLRALLERWIDQGYSRTM